MSPIEMKGWPLVTVSFNAQASDEDARQWFADMSAMLERHEPFAIVMKAKPDSHFSPEARKELGLWFKNNRTLLGSFCKATGRVVDSVEHGERVVSENMKKAMPFPMKAFLTFEAAVSWAEEQLSQ